MGSSKEILKEGQEDLRRGISSQNLNDSNSHGHSERMEMGVMMRNSFPKESSSRRVILVLQEHDIEKCVIEPDVGRQLLLDDEIYILQYPVRLEDETPLVLQNILESDQVRPGVVLLQSPFDRDVYEDAVVAPQRFALAKHMYFSTLCRYLGATRVSVEQVTIETKEGRDTINFDASRDLVGGGSVRIENERLRSLVNSMQLEDKFAGGMTDVSSAERIMKKTGLWTDPNIRTLLTMRSDGGNRLLSRRLVLNLTNDIKSNMNVAARVNVPSFVHLSADYSRVVHEQYDFSLTVLVEF